MFNDMILCLADNCPIKHSCYRFTVQVFGRKIFFERAPYNFDNNCCKEFICNRPHEDQIRFRAYAIWQQMGCPDGKSTEHWLQAETELSNIPVHPEITTN